MITLLLVSLQFIKKKSNGYIRVSIINDWLPKKGNVIYLILKTNKSSNEVQFKSWLPILFSTNFCNVVKEKSAAITSYLILCKNKK